MFRLLAPAAILASVLVHGSLVIAAEPLIYFNSTSEQAKPLPAPPVARHNRSVAVAVHTEPTASSKPIASPLPPPKPEAKSDPRRLAPRSRSSFDPPSNPASKGDRAALPFSTPQIESLGTAGAGLAIVLGLFFVCAWLLRRTGPKPNSPLPREAIAVLGRVPLAGRNFAQLIQIGNKLVLVSIAPDGVATPITEVTDPTEVDRLLGICMRENKHSTTAEFQQVLQQLANEPAKGFLGSQAQTMPTGTRR
ncbi:MAG: FliO/MopB family protein [Planctomycetes bacterium]|nr:FliO/MopB family protein [Planctomycetota bacterium]